MRSKKSILIDYLDYLNEEKKLGYSKEEIEKKIKNPAEAAEVEKLLFNDLYSTQNEKGTTCSTLNAFWTFCEMIVRNDLKTGDRIWNGFVKKQFNLVEFNKMVCYMAARGHGKTFFIALYCIFKMFIIPGYDIGYCSNIPRQRRRFLKLCRMIIDSNEMLVEKKDSKGVANKMIPWGTEEVEYNEGLLEGTTVGTTPRGGHYNLAIGDDPLRDDQKYTYDYIANYFQGVYKQTVLRKKGRYIIVGTPQDGDDLFHTLMNDKLDKNNRPIGRVCREKTSAAGFYSTIFPGILNDIRKEVLVPEIWTYGELLEEKGRIGEIRFNREILCQCITFKNALIGTSLFKSCCDENLSMIQKGAMGKHYVIFVDSATSDAPTADYCAMSVWEDDTQGQKFIFRHLFHEKGYPITDPTGGTDDQAHVLHKLWKDFNKAFVIVEKNNAGIALIQAATALGIPEILEHFTHSPASGQATVKAGKSDDVINYIEGLKSGAVVFPANPEDIYTLDCLQKIKVEHLNFGVKKGKSGEKYEAIAGHDDIFDSCWGAFKFRGDMIDTLPAALTIDGGVGI